MIYRFPMICNIVICFATPSSMKQWNYYIFIHIFHDISRVTILTRLFLLIPMCIVSYFRFYITSRYRRQRKIFYIHVLFIHARHGELSRKKYRMYGKLEIFEDSNQKVDLNLNTKRIHVYYVEAERCPYHMFDLTHVQN